MNEKEQTFNTPEINNVTKTSGVIPADVVVNEQPTLNVPEVNMRETAPLADQSVNEAQAQVQEQTKLQELTAQKITDRDAQRVEQQNLIATLGGQGQELQQAFNQGEAQLEPIAKEITDLTSLINTKTQAIQNQLLDESGRRIPQAFITGRQAIIQQRGTAELSALSGLLDAKNGQMTLAQNKLDRSLNILREVNRAELAEKEARVSLLKEITGESKEEEENEITRLKEEQAKYDAERDSISAIGLQAMQAGAGAGEITAITNAKSKDEAIAAAKSLGIDAKLSRTLKNLQITNERQKISKARADAAAQEMLMSSGGLDQETKEKISKDKSAQGAIALITVDRAFATYEKRLKEIGNNPTRKERKELNAIVTNTVAPSLAVANGQGAMTDDEREGIIKDIGVSYWGWESTTQKNLAAVRKAQQAKTDIMLQAVDSTYAGASSNFDVFAEYEDGLLTEELGDESVRIQNLSTEKIEQLGSIADAIGIDPSEALMDNEIYQLLNS